MLKALIKKQLMELFQSWLKPGKKGVRSKKSLIAMGVFMAVALLVLAFVFASLCTAFLITIEGYDWLYFTVMGILSILFGLFGSVFATYSSLYLSKDNEQLFSMPIPPYMILLVRMLAVLFMSALYSGIIWLPTIVVYCIFREPTFLNILFSILNWVSICTLISTLTCLLGWLVAMISQHFKRKNIVLIILYGVAFVGYLLLCSTFSTLLDNFSQSIDPIANGIIKWAYPLYHLGAGAAGEVLPFLSFTAHCLLLFGICILIMSLNYRKLVTASPRKKKVVYVEKKAVKTSALLALMHKDRRFFLGNATYFINCGLGAVLMLFVAVCGVVGLPEIVALFKTELPEFLPMLPPVVLVVLSFLITLDCDTAASISIEAKTLWLLHSLPIRGWDVLKAKNLWHVIFNLPPALICTLCLAIPLQAAWYEVILLLILATMLVWFSGYLGLTFNLLRPNLTWTNINIPVKQGLPIFLMVLCSFLMTAILGASIALCLWIPSAVILLGWTLIFGGLIALLHFWLKNHGEEIFDRL